MLIYVYMSKGSLASHLYSEFAMNLYFSVSVYICMYIHMMFVYILRANCVLIAKNSM